MKKFKSYIFILLPAILLSGCSWSEYFVVNNLSDHPIFINYTISEPKDHNFGIFDPNPKFYKATKNGNIDWNNKIELKDLDESNEIVSIYLPSNTIMIFGRLNNDKYTSYDQYFINSREFNFDYMEVEVNLNVFHISKNTFDKNFIKDKGIIKFEVE